MALAVLFAAVVMAPAMAALRLAAAMGADGWARAAAAAAFFGALAAAVPLLLGLVGAGGSTVALAAGAIAPAAVVFLRAPRPGPAGLLLGRSRGERAAFAAAAGAASGVLVWLLAYPLVRTDSFHLVEAVRWLHGGHPGSVELTIHEWPAGNYPLVNELVLTWGLGLARSLVPVHFWTLSMAVLLAGCSYSALRGLQVSWLVAAAAALGTVAATFAFSTFEGAATDLPSLAWLAATACLLVHARRNPRLLAPAALAAGLAVGTKSTTAPIVIALVIAFFWHQPRLAYRTREVALASVFALCLALAWPVRNLIEHGSPLWPFSSFAGLGDPVPYALDHLQTTFLDRPAATVEVLWQDDPSNVLVTALLFVAVACAALSARRRGAVLVALLSLGALVLWSVSPITGKPQDFAGEWTTSVLRYLLPAVTVGFAALALTSREPGRTGRFARVAVMLLAAGFVVAGYDMYFWGSRAVAAAAIGGGAIAGLALLARRVPGPHTVTLITGCVLALACWGLADRREALHPAVDEAVQWIHEREDFANDRRPVVFNFRPEALFAGPELRHDLVLLGTDTPCERVRRLASSSWLVIWRDRFVRMEPYRPSRGETCLPDRRPAFQNDFLAIHVP